MNKERLDKFLIELKEVFDKNLEYNQLSDLIRSADLLVDTLKKEQTKPLSLLPTVFLRRSHWLTK